MRLRAQGAAGLAALSGCSAAAAHRPTPAYGTTLPLTGGEEHARHRAYGIGRDFGRRRCDGGLLRVRVQNLAPARGRAPAVIGPFDRNADPTPDGEVDFSGQHFVIPGGRYQGYTVGDVAWYRKHFRTPRRHQEHHGHRVELRFDGVYGRTDVWLNEAHLGFHAKGYTPSAYDLTPHLNRHRDNVLAVRADNRGKTSRWYTTRASTGEATRLVAAEHVDIVGHYLLRETRPVSPDSFGRCFASCDALKSHTDFTHAEFDPGTRSSIYMS